ncbi:MAG: tRNA pseudouridine(13) synthase TruD [Oleiphilaceae bacterium]|nr:tRNA pseudouridine(13) synthase TruD [Oleiphilaceae bacterium]
MSEPKWRLDWPGGQGEPCGRATLKAKPEHFRVDEELALDGFPGDASGVSPETLLARDGEHLCLQIEKTGDNTEYVARQLANLSGCQPHEVGFCGLKDRHAVTRQWFSVHRAGMVDSDPDFLALVQARWRVHRVCRFMRKLRRGEHRGNRFSILLTSVCGDRARLEQGLIHLQAKGCPNYFGSQRFGWDGNNLDQACRLKPGRQRGRNNRNGMYFSAARSWLFNEILAARVTAGTWAQALAGEPDSCEATGPLWGDGGTEAGDEQGSLEREIVSRHPALAAVFSQTRMKPERRSLVLLPEDFRWTWEGADGLRLKFGLGPGQFATTLLADLFLVDDASQNTAD